MARLYRARCNVCEETTDWLASDDKQRDYCRKCGLDVWKQREVLNKRAAERMAVQAIIDEYLAKHLATKKARQAATAAIAAARLGARAAAVEDCLEAIRACARKSDRADIVNIMVNGAVDYVADRVSNLLNGKVKLNSK